MLPLKIRQTLLLPLVTFGEKCTQLYPYLFAPMGAPKGNKNK